MPPIGVIVIFSLLCSPSGTEIRDHITGSDADNVYPVTSFPINALIVAFK